MGNKTIEKSGTPLVLSNSNFWLGNEDSLENVYNLNRFLANPSAELLQNMRMGWDDDEEGSDSPYAGIGSHLIQTEGNLGIVHVSGSLINRFSYYNKYFGVVSYQEIRDATASLANDSSIKDILVITDTNGGSAHGCPETADFIRNIDSNIKPVYFHSSNFCFSAGMWLASSGRRFTANRIAEQGSVGVVVTLMSYYKMYSDMGVEFKTVRAGKYKALGQPTEPLSEQVISMIEEKAERLYGYFVEAISSGRPALSIATKEMWAEGKTFFSEDSLQLGMIDEITTFDNLVAKFLTSYDNVSSQTYYAEVNPSRNLEEQPMGDKTKTTTKKVVLTPEMAAAVASGAELNAEDLPEENLAEENLAEENLADQEPKNTDLSAAAPQASAADPEGGLSLQDKFINQSVELKTVQAKVTQLEAAVEASLAESELLKGMAIQAINNLEIAVGKSPTSSTMLSEMSAQTLLNLNTELKASFSKRYSVGGPKSATMSEDRSEEDSLKTSFCNIVKPE